MIKYPPKGIFRRVFFYFLTLARVRKTNKKQKSLYGKIAVFRRLVCFFESVLSIIIK